MKGELWDNIFVLVSPAKVQGHAQYSNYAHADAFHLKLIK